MVNKTSNKIPTRINLYNNNRLWNPIKRIQAILLLNGHDKVSMSNIVEFAINELIRNTTDYEIVEKFEKYNNDKYVQS